MPHISASRTAGMVEGPTSRRRHRNQTKWGFFQTEPLSKNEGLWSWLAYFRDGIGALGNEAMIFATGISLQVGGELGIGADGGLDGDDDIAGEVGDSGDCGGGRHGQLGFLKECFRRQWQEIPAWCLILELSLSVTVSGRKEFAERPLGAGEEGPSDAPAHPRGLASHTPPSRIVYPQGQSQSQCEG